MLHRAVAGGLAAVLLVLPGPPARAAQPVAAPLRVIVCDSHHHALRHWLEAAQAGLLPESGVSVVHFDAHPDMGPPKQPFDRALRVRPGAVVAQLDIESFQLAAVWLGLVSRVVWLRPGWAFQLADGSRRFRVGLGPGGLLRVDEPADYYVLEGYYAPTAALRDPVPLELAVLALPAARPGVALHTGPAILDIDLDGFATRNPAADALRAAGFSDAELARIRSAFARDRLALPDDPEARRAALERLLAAMDAVAGGSLPAQLAGAVRVWWMGVRAADLWFLYGILADPERADSAGALREHGLVLVGLPERPADPTEIRTTAAQLAGLLQSGAVRPSLVTIARSANDGYTPHAAWPAIEWALLDALREVRPDLDVRYDRGVYPAPRPAAALNAGTATGR
jgi:hypothetical protein